MKYLCLVYLDADTRHSVPGAAAADWDAECAAYDEALREQAHCLAGEALQPWPAAATVRVRDGQLLVAGGGSSGARDELARFYLLEARDLNAAIRMAAQLPTARLGKVEVRPIQEPGKA